MMNPSSIQGEWEEETTAVDVPIPMTELVQAPPTASVHSDELEWRP